MDTHEGTPSLHYTAGKHHVTIDGSVQGWEVIIKPTFGSSDLEQKKHVQSWQMLNGGSVSGDTVEKLNALTRLYNGAILLELEHRGRRTFAHDRAKGQWEVLLRLPKGNNAFLADNAWSPLEISADIEGAFAALRHCVEQLLTQHRTRQA